MNRPSASPAGSGPAAPPPWRGEAQTITLIGLAHGTSHFFHLLLPPLFPWLIRDFGLSYAELGALMSVFFVVSGTGQAAAGFLVDRVGARPVLFTALGCFALAALAAASASGYGGLLAAAALAGLGNASFHPVDFTILNKRVSVPRLGHAFSVHGISGNLGWAAAPVFLTGLTAATGSWRAALAAAALWALLVLAVLLLGRNALDDRAGRMPARATGDANRARTATSTGPAGGHGEPLLAFLRLPSVWLCFSFFFWTTCALSAVQGFAAPALGQLYHVTAGQASLVVTGYMVSGAVGMVAGGFLMARTARLERIISACLLGAAAVLLAVGQRWLPGGEHAGWLALVVTAAAGIGTGLAGPSRDMLIRQAAPAGATGRVYGLVYSGLDLGFAVAAPVLGHLMDRGRPGLVFTAAAAALCLGVASAAAVGSGIQRRRGLLQQAAA